LSQFEALGEELGVRQPFGETEAVVEAEAARELTRALAPLVAPEHGRIAHHVRGSKDSWGDRLLLCCFGQEWHGGQSVLPVEGGGLRVRRLLTAGNLCFRSSKEFIDAPAAVVTQFDLLSDEASSIRLQRSDYYLLLDEAGYRIARDHLFAAAEAFGAGGACRLKNCLEPPSAILGVAVSQAMDMLSEQAGTIAGLSRLELLGTAADFCRFGVVVLPDLDSMDRIEGSLLVAPRMTEHIYAAEFTYDGIALRTRTTALDVSSYSLY